MNHESFLEKYAFAGVLGHSEGADRPFYLRQEAGEKTASVSDLLPSARDFLSNVTPERGFRYLLVNAMGAYEYWGPNSNHDSWPEAALCHLPPEWTGKPVLDKALVERVDWPYGLPTFYFAHAFAHHVNKDPAKKVGDVVFADWNDRMKRVELVMRVERERCAKYNAQSFWDRMEQGEFPAVSMGSKVPWDRCFPAGTLVRAEDGYRRIETLSVGDFVLTHTGRLRPVTRAMSRVAKVRLLEVTGLPSLRVTDEHPFLVLRKSAVRSCIGSSGGKRPGHRFDLDSSTCRRCGKDVTFSAEWVEAKDVVEGDFVASLAKRCGDVRDVRISPFLVGAWLGDGFCIRKTKDSHVEGVSFSLGKRKGEVLRHLQEYLEGMGLTPRVYDQDTSWVLNAYSRELAEDLESRFGRGSSGKRLPDEVFFWPVDAKRALLEGYISTDGSMSEDGVARVASINRGLLLDVRELLLSVGVPATIQKQPRRAGGFSSDAEIFHLRFNWKSQTPAARGFFYQGLYFSPVVSNRGEETQVEVFNLSVEEDESYVAEGLITHNCSSCTDLDEFYKALASFDPKKHKHPGIAVLRWHERKIKETGKGIRGIARTRAEYCECMRRRAGTIDPRTGLKIFVHNDFPRFFDISMVRIGADKTAYTMIALGEGDRLMNKIAQVPHQYGSLGGANLSEALRGQFGAKGTDLQEAIRSTGGSTVAEAFLNLDRTPREVEAKIASDWFAAVLDEEPFWQEKLAYDPERIAQLVSSYEKVSGVKAAIQRKKGEIAKETPAEVSQVARTERELPPDIYEDLAKHPMPLALGSLGAAGIVLRPREFCRMCICRMGLQDEYAPSDLPFMPSEGRMPLRALPSLLGLLAPHMLMRSGFEEPLRMRVMLVGPAPKLAADSSHKLLPSLGEARLSKLGSLYRSYRDSLMDFLPHAPDLLSEHFAKDKTAAVQSFEASDLFTHLSYAYFQTAFMDELLR